jgi:hypothetical protein
MNKKESQSFITGNISSITPLQVKLTPSDDAINVKALNHLVNVKVGSNVLMVKILNKFIIIGVIGNIIQAHCLLTRTTTQSIPSSSFTYLDFSSNTTEVDPSSMFDGTNKITIPVNGLYNVNVGYRWQDSTTSTIRITEILLNGTIINSKAGRPDANGRYGVNISLNLSLSTDDYIQIRVYHATGSNINVGAVTSSYGYTYFSIVPIKTC